ALQEPHGALAKRQRELCSDESPGGAADAVGPEQLACHRRLALRELRTLARLLQTGLLALLHTRIARQKAPPLELAAEIRVGLQQGPRNPMAQGPGLRR